MYNNKQECERIQIAYAATVRDSCKGIIYRIISVWNSFHHLTSVNRSNSEVEYNNIMSPYQTAVSMDDRGDGHEIIEVQILPQDENWGENTTAITGNTSDQSGSAEEMALWPNNENHGGLSLLCNRYISTIFAITLSTISFVSPLIMLVLPKLGVFPAIMTDFNEPQKSRFLSCRSECKSILVTMFLKMALLAIGWWALWMRSPRRNSVMPRIFLYRAVVLLLVLLCCVVYWIFYFVQFAEGARATLTGDDDLQFRTIVTYSSGMIDALLFVHYVAVALIELRHLQPTFYVRVIRSPDGESRSYPIGRLSIQRAAMWILDRYYTDFPIYNPYLDRLPVSRSKKSTTSYKFYDVDGFGNNGTQSSQPRVALSHCSGMRRRDSSHNERFYEEHDYERRVKKRRARLITATEDAFTHIKRIHSDTGGAMPMSAQEAAQAVFPSLARALQKYLRVTRQQPQHSVESILDHLALCLSHDMSPKAFLESYLTTSPVLQCEKERKPMQNWSLICDEMLSRPLSDGCVFQLRQNDISMLCIVRSLPAFNVTEEIIHPKMNRFVLRMNSETSV